MPSSVSIAIAFSPGFDRQFLIVAIRELRRRGNDPFGRSPETHQRALFFGFLKCRRDYTRTAALDLSTNVLTVG
jgi:hypothetical protein